MLNIGTDQQFETTIIAFFKFMLCTFLYCVKDILDMLTIASSLKNYGHNLINQISLVYAGWEDPFALCMTIKIK